MILFPLAEIRSARYKMDRHFVRRIVFPSSLSAVAKAVSLDHDFWGMDTFSTPVANRVPEMIPRVDRMVHIRFQPK